MIPRAEKLKLAPFVDHTDARSVAGCGTDDCAE
jgi:hypothetical protein